MPSPLAIAQFARIVGRALVLERLGLPPDAPVPDALTDDQRERTRALARECVEPIARALLDEAMANDDIQSAAAATAYLEERLQFFGPLLDDDTRAAIRTAFAAVAGTWR